MATTPPTTKRSSLFPSYLPPNDEHPSFEHMAAHLDAWGKRVLTLTGIVSLLIAGAGFLGFQVLGPKHTAERVAALEDSVGTHSRRIADIERLMRTNIYLSCQVLTRVQPPRAIVPEECK